MKKFTLVLMMMLSYTGLTMAQTIEDFESITMNVFASGTNGMMEVVPNPDMTGANTSYNVVKFVRGKDGDPWAGFYTTLSTGIDVSANKYVHVKVWKPRISPVVFKVERADGNYEVKNTAQTLTNAWEELVFDFNTVAASGEYVKVVLFPDFPDAVGLDDDIVIYFDDITINNDPTVGSAPVTVMEDYENIPLNLMAGGADDQSSFTKITNPDKSGANLSNSVIKFNRDMNGVPWGGFWSRLPAEVDVTTNKYVHVKVWKPRISPVKFKLEGGAAGTQELASMNPQTKINAWEDMVFDFSSKTGTYPIIAFMPDFADPVDLTEDITIYFDDFIVNNDPNPMTEPTQLIGLDLRDVVVPAGEKVWITGAFGGIYGTWNEPGTNVHNELTDPDGDGIYTVWFHLPDGVIAFKFVIGSGWGNQDPFGQDRTYEVVGNVYVIFKWNVAGFTLNVPENLLTGKIQMYPNPVINELYINSTIGLQSVTITSALGNVVGNYTLTSSGNQTISTSNLSSGLYFVTVVGKDGHRVTQKLIKN